MGCCHPEKKPEENELLSFFNKMERENKFNFTIEKYEDNYDIIINLSSNSFKKLKKKQQVRIGFVGEILKNINKIYIEEKEEKITKRIIFYILILTLTLDNYLKERKETNMTNSNDLEQFLLTLVIKVLNKPFKDFQNLKIVLYYLANMLVILFPEIKDINHYFNIEKYIDLIYKITEKDNALNSDEIYPFIKVNLICLGGCFLSNYPQINLEEKYINILIRYYVEGYFFNLSFLIENFTVFNKYLFFYNMYYNNSINKTINNNNITKIAINDMINKNNNYLSISNIKTYTNINDISNCSLNQSRIINNNFYRTSYISNMDDLSFNNNNFFEIIKTQDFEDIQKITFSLYSFLKTTSQDTLTGKKIFKYLEDTIEEKIRDNNNNNIIIIKKPSFMHRNSSNSFNPEQYFNKNIFKIIYLFLVNKCKIENDKIIVISLLYYISDTIKEEKYKEQYYDILLQLFFLFNNEQIKQMIINLLSHTFIKDVEKQNSFDFIEDMFGISQTNSFNSFGVNKMKIIKHFLIKISKNIKEIQNINLRIKMLIKLTDIMDKYIKIYNKNSIEIPSNDMPSSDNQVKYKIEKDILMNMFHNFELDNDNFDDDNNNELYYFFFINYIKFFNIFFLFMSYNFICEELFKDLATRKIVFNKFINYITQLEIFSIQGEKSYVNDIINIMKLILKIIGKYSIECFSDFRILCSYFGNSLQKISKISNKHKIIDFHILKLSYTVLIFLLIQLKKIFRLPTSIVKIHNEIIECIKNINNDISQFLNEINIELYSDSKLNKQIYQDLKKYLKNEIKLEIEPKIFRQIIDIIYSKLFGKTSYLFIFLESQNYKISSYEEGKKSENIDITEETIYSFQNINYQSNFANDINLNLKFMEERDSAVSPKKNEEHSQKLSLPKISLDNKDIFLNRKDIDSSEIELTDKIKI